MTATTKSNERPFWTLVVAFSALRRGRRPHHGIVQPLISSGLGRTEVITMLRLAPHSWSHPPVSFLDPQPGCQLYLSARPLQLAQFIFGFSVTRYVCCQLKPQGPQSRTSSVSVYLREDNGSGAILFSGKRGHYEIC